jgi:predicted RNA binding protein YcfA (HicA-like mRNA interferase family)
MSPALPIMSGLEVVKSLELIGFIQVSQRGSHVKLRHEDGRIVVVPMHKELAKGTLRSILRQAGIEGNEFIKLVRG